MSIGPQRVSVNLCLGLLKGKDWKLDVIKKYRNGVNLASRIHYSAARPTASLKESHCMELTLRYKNTYNCCEMATYGIVYVKDTNLVTNLASEVST